MCSIDWLSQMVPHVQLQGLNFSLLVVVWFCLDPAECLKLEKGHYCLFAFSEIVGFWCGLLLTGSEGKLAEGSTGSFRLS